MKRAFIHEISCFLMLFGCGQTDKNETFTSEFGQESCSFISTGKNRYFILEPGYRLILEGMDGKDTARLVVTVLPGVRTIGGIETRIVEEKETLNGQIVEISRNYFSFCKESGSIFYFGEEVDIYEEGTIVSHDGAWMAEGENKAGVMMPGNFLIGSRYYQEYAPGTAMDRAEIISTSESLVTPAGKFHNCLVVKETSPLEPNATGMKIYAPGIGMIKDDGLVLVNHGKL